MSLTFEQARLVARKILSSCNLVCYRELEKLCGTINPGHKSAGNYTDPKDVLATWILSDVQTNRAKLMDIAKQYAAIHKDWWAAFWLYGEPNLNHNS